VLHIGLVLEEDTIASRKDRLNSLQPSLTQTFRETMDRIEDSTKTKINATKILTWIHLAKRPLTVDELLHALAVKEEKEDLDRENLKDPGTFLNCCLGLVTIDAETSTVRLVHLLLHEYFTERCQIFEQTLKQGHASITRSCLRYIMFRPLMVNLLPGRDYPAGEAQIILQYPLLDYAASEWGHHLQNSGREEESLVELAHTYLSMDTQKYCWSQWRLCKHISRNNSLENFVISFSKLHIAAYFGIDLVLSRMQLEATELNSEDSKGWTPLTWAIERDNTEVIQLLLHNHVKVEYWYKIVSEYSQD
jgi:hypothetical protein